MKSTTPISKRERILGGLWSSLVGDALGVPVEFKDRATVQSDPVRDMLGFGTHKQPPGTWSDDSSLLLCTVESLAGHPFDTDDMGKRFCAWYREELWTPHGSVFDAGATTVNALSRIASGVRAEFAGGDKADNNGNGSLMRIIPVSLRFADQTVKVALDRVHRASAITHRHARSQMACGLFTLLIRELLNGQDATQAIANARAEFQQYYAMDSWWAIELEHFEMVLDGNLSLEPEWKIMSTGYVLDTLAASIWCLLTTGSFDECVLKAVNLGGDTDTTGCVAAGLAGVCYGMQAIPSRWIHALARHDEVESLFGRFAGMISSAP